jgi:hypothetical protein
MLLCQNALYLFHFGAITAVNITAAAALAKKTRENISQGQKTAVPISRADDSLVILTGLLITLVPITLVPITLAGIAHGAGKDSGEQSGVGEQVLHYGEIGKKSGY